MRSNSLLIGIMALACLLVQACAAQDPQELVDQAKVEQMNKQIMGERGTDTGSYKGEPWANSSLNDSNKKNISVETISAVVVSSDYMVKTDSFLKGAMNNGYYVLTVSKFLNKTVADKNWAIVDVRPAELYASGHIAGAINIPLANLISQMGMIPAGRKVAVYCALDTNAAFAVQTLRVYGGRDAFVLSDGMAAWQAAGMPVLT